MGEEQNITEDLVIEPLPEEEAESKGGVPVTQQLMLVAGILVLIFGTTVTTKLFSIFNDSEKPSTQEKAYTEEIEGKEKIDHKQIKPFNDIEIVGRAAYVWDVTAQRALYKKNETDSLPLASVTKLMTALLANEILSESATVWISDPALSQHGDSGLLRDESFKRQTLSDLVLMSSSNDGAFALAMAAGDELTSADPAKAFVAAMNVRAGEIGLKDTVFYNPTGLDENTTTAGAYGSAKDMAFLMEYIVKNSPDILKYTQEDNARIYSEGGEYHDANNTNYYVSEIPNLIGSKTGYTDLSGGNLVVAYDAGLNRPIIIAVLGSTKQNRFTDVLKLIEATNSQLSN